MNGIAAFLASGINSVNLLYMMIVLPVVFAVLCILLPRSQVALRGGLLLLAVTANLFFAIGLFGAEDFTALIPWASNFQINLALRVYGFSRFMILFAAAMVFLIGLYSVAFTKRKAYHGPFFFFYLIALALANGAFLANNLVVMLFFWEGMLVVLFGMLALLQKNNLKTAIKAIALNGIADLLLMLGIALTCLSAGSLMMDMISAIPVEGTGILGFVCIMAGAVGKAGAMPFHSWIPDAADDAPLPFMLVLPSALEKMMGIYLLARIVLDFYDLQPGSDMSLLLLIIGAATIVFTAAMTLVQKDMKRMLAYSSISQVGYMIVGIGTALPVGIVGGLFHLVNHIVYKCCLFMSAGAVEKAAGSTDLRKIGGIGRLMPITGLCFIVGSLSICGVPPFNGFFSKELIFDAALESGMVFYIAAVVGAFLMSASFLKFAHAAFFGPTKLPETVRKADVKEAPAAMLLPMLVLAFGCLSLGVWNTLPLQMVQPLLGDALAGQSFFGWPHSVTLVMISLAVILLAVLNHAIGYRATGEGMKVADHIRFAPGFKQIYSSAERHYFDPYDILMVFINLFAWLCFCIDRGIDWIYNVLLVRLTTFCANALRNFNTGRIGSYMVWTLSGFTFLLLLFLLLI